VFPGYVRSPEDAIFWLTAWFEHLGADRLEPSELVLARREPSGLLAELKVQGASAHFRQGNRLVVSADLTGHLEARRYTFDLIGPEGRLWGWHGHTEPAGFHHRHDPPGFLAVASEPATFEAVAELVHRI
jgi:hypothetical protein